LAGALVLLDDFELLVKDNDRSDLVEELWWVNIKSSYTRRKLSQKVG
jgi:hypothetical protein